MRQNYVDALLDEARWTDLAKTLLSAAKALQLQVDTLWANRSEHARDRSVPLISDAPLRVQMMLLSFAVENKMKAFLVRKKKADYGHQLNANPTLPKELRSHDLVALAMKTTEIQPRLTLDDEREEFLRRLTRRAQWAGRYPVPVKWRDMPGLQKSSKGKLGSTTFETNMDLAQAESLLGELCSELDLRPRNRT